MVLTHSSSPQYEKPIWNTWFRKGEREEELGRNFVKQEESKRKATEGRGSRQRQPRGHGPERAGGLPYRPMTN